MINNGMDIENPSFKSYQTEYSKYYLEYEQKKKALEKEYVKPEETGAKKWDLDFATRELTIEY